MYLEVIQEVARPFFGIQITSKGTWAGERCNYSMLGSYCFVDMSCSYFLTCFVCSAVLSYCENYISLAASSCMMTDTLKAIYYGIQHILRTFRLAVHDIVSKSARFEINSEAIPNLQGWQGILESLSALIKVSTSCIINVIVCTRTQQMSVSN